MDIREIDAREVTRILGLEEGHYLDLKRIAIAPAKLSESVSAFANTAGGELFIGIAEIKGQDGNVIRREWDGFPDQEAANSHVKVVEGLTPLGCHCKFEFLRSDDVPGYVLYVLVFKVKEIVCATNGIPHRRKVAQNLKVEGDDALRRLRLDKGIQSFEDETVDVDTARIGNSTKIIEFMLEVVPAANPEDWIKKQNLVTGNKPTVAGILLFDDEPQSAIPKRSAIKIYRYKTKDEEGERDTLAFDPITIEGCVYDQIYGAVSKTKELVEGVQRLGPAGLESVSYPDETLHEIITNAVIHRDYSISTDIHIRIFDNRIEVESPGRLSGHVTAKNISEEQSARNPKVVRLINKFPNPPNKDVGEGINTAFEAMKRMKLKEPLIVERDNSLLVNIRHENLASPAAAVLDYLEIHIEITNAIARDLTGIKSENSMKDVFLALKKRGLIEQVPGKRGSAYAWRRSTNEPKTFTSGVKIRTRAKT